MITAELPRDEKERIAALKSSDILDTVPEENFDRITELAAGIFAVPIVLITMVDSNRQWFKSKIGLDVSETHRDYAFCSHAILENGVCLVKDASEDARFFDNPLVVSDPSIRFYAGAPITTPDGFKLGTLCIIDTVPRSDFTDQDALTLQRLAEMVSREIELRNSLKSQIKERQSIQSLFERNKTAIDAGQVAVFEWDLKSGKVSSDKTLAELHGYFEPRHDFCYKDWEAALHPEDKSETLEHLNKAIAGNGAYDTDFRIRWPSGEIRYIRAKGQIFYDEAGKPSRMAGANWDVTERQALLEQVKAEKQVAERANASKSEFLTTMSHELRTPMNAILGFSQLLQGCAFGPLNEKQIEFVDTVLNSGAHLLKLIDEVLELSKIEAGRTVLVIEAIELVPVAKSVQASLEHMAEKYGIRIYDADFGHGLPQISADRTRLVQCLTNLGSNAIKYNRPRGTVSFRYEALDNELIRISVQDTGYGIPVDKQSELFQPFNRLGAELKAIEGTGIGLALTKRLVKMMGGSIGFKSVPDEGTTFWIDLPCHKIDPTAASAQRNVREIVKFKSGLKVLYVEDNATNRNLMSNILETHDAVNLILAQDAKSGVSAALRERPDVIILDINLPDHDGFWVLEKLRSFPEFSSTPIFALSANAMPFHVKGGLEAGFSRYLSKPFVVAELLEALNLAVSKPTRKVPALKLALSA